MTYWKKIGNRKYSIFDDDNKKEKEEYLKELGASIHNYIRIGVKNSRLEELLKQEEEFQDRYRKRFAVDELIRIIKKDSREKIEACGQLEKKESQGECRKELQESTENRELFFQSIFASLEEILESRLNSMLMDAVYLSHVNMLYELYEKEETLRKEEKKFREISDRFQKLADISKKISRQRRMELKELEREVEMSEQELLFLLNICKGLFNVRHTSNKILISLSSEGRRYSDFISNDVNRCSDEALNQYMYKNCTNIIDSLRKSYCFGMRHKPQLSGLRPDSERAIMHKYYQALDDISHVRRKGSVIIDEEVDNMAEESLYSIEREGIYGKYKVKL